MERQAEYAKAKAAGMARATMGRKTRFPSAKEQRHEWRDKWHRRAIREGRLDYEAYE